MFSRGYDTFSLDWMFDIYTFPYSDSYMGSKLGTKYSFNL